MPLQARIWGCRGSLPTPGEATVRYGGNTPCVEIRTDDGGLLILDAGTGIKRLGAVLELDGPVHVLLTHLHLDHVEGLRFFAPFWRPGAELHIWGPPSPLHTLEERIARAFSPPLFPLELADTAANVTFHDVPHETWEIGGVRIDAQSVSHPGPTLGYRLGLNGSSLAYIPDHEPVLGVEMADLEPEWISGHGLAETSTSSSTTASSARPSTRPGSGGGTRASPTPSSSRSAPTSGGSCSSTTTPDRSDDGVDGLVERAQELWDGASPEPPVAACEGKALTSRGGVH